MHAVARTLLLAALALPSSKPTPAQTTRTPVIVELFTSEGCSSCPPADAILAQLDRTQPVPFADIIVLGEHVDYWDGQGWRDRFSSVSFTERQRDYQYFFKLDDIFTPQAVVNGSVQLSGGDRDGIRAAVQNAAPKTVALKLSSVETHGNTVTFSLANGPATHAEPVSIYAALVDPADTTEVHGGENNSRTLHHAGVVRTLASVGSNVHLDALGQKPYTIRLRTSGSVNGMRLVVFAQTRHIGPILGAASCVLNGTPTAGIAPFPANPCPSNPSPTISAAQ